MADVFGGIAEDRRAAALVAIASVADPASVTGRAPRRRRSGRGADGLRGRTSVDGVPRRRAGPRRALGEMVARLQATAPFPPVTKDFGALVEAFLKLVRDGGLFAPGALDGHVAGLARIRAEFPRPAEQMSAHNDINPRNVLFDGRRLWLVDRELAFRNDPLAAVANIANNFVEVPVVDTFVLRGLAGSVPRRRHPPPPLADA